MKFELCAENSSNNEIVLPDTSARFLSALYRVSKKHDIAHLVGDALIKNGLIENGDIKSQFQNQIVMAVYRYENLNYELGRICELLEESEIPFIPLKGAVIRKFYPEPWMRTSCDIDILVHEEDLERATAMLKEKLGYTYERKEKGSHDMQMYSLSGVHLELHYTLLEEGRLLKADKILSNIWNYAEEERKGSFQKRFSDEAFYFYHMAHMAKHFMIGGCGIKPFVDLWILNRSKKNKIDKEKRDELLLNGGLFKFAKEVETLSEVWFEGIEHTETTKQMEKYVLQGGVYGTMQNRVVVQQVKSGSKFKYTISRIWLPYDTLKFLYPVLQKQKWLFLFCQVRRWFRLLFKGGFKRSVNELSISGSVTKEQRKEISSFLSELDLQ
ncbi:MAG: nucleotidyltransferase family protein [Candidatus Scatosoma sp.]